MEILQKIRKQKWILGVTIIPLIIIIAVISSSGNNSSEIIKPDNIVGQSEASENISGEIKEYDYTEAIDHIGEKAIVSGEVLRVFTAKSGVTFLDFCEDFSDCPFSAVIFASDMKKFPDVSQYERKVRITGLIKSYNGKAEIILKNPEQIE